jgi:hypothetical protein
MAMHRLILLFLLVGLAAGAGLAAEPPQLLKDYPEIRLPDGTVFKNARVGKVVDSVFHIEHQNGITKVPLQKMPPEWRPLAENSEAQQQPAQPERRFYVLGQVIKESSSSVEVFAGQLKFQLAGWSSGSNLPPLQGRFVISPRPAVFQSRNANGTRYVHCEVEMTGEGTARLLRNLAPLPESSAAQKPEPAAAPAATPKPPLRLAGGEGDTIKFGEHGGPECVLDVLKVTEESVRIRRLFGGGTQTFTRPRGAHTIQVPIYRENGQVVYWIGNSGGTAVFEVAKEEGP